MCMRKLNINTEQFSSCVLFFLTVIMVFTYNDRLPLKVDVVDAHHLVGREGNNKKTLSTHGEF